MLGFVMFLMGAMLISPEPRPAEAAKPEAPKHEWSALFAAPEPVLYLGDPAWQKELPDRLREARAHGITHVGLAGEPARVQPLLDGFVEGRLREVDLELA